MEKQKDIRLNKDYRTAYIKDFRRFLESKQDNPKYEAFLSAKTLCKTRIDDAFKVATKVIHRVYSPKMFLHYNNYRRNIILLMQQQKPVVFIWQLLIVRANL